MCLTALIAHLLFGGGSSYADTRYRYDVFAEKVGSGIKTNFIVYSKSLEEAKEEVTLNGWKVISAKKLDSSETVLKKDEKVLNTKDSLNKISDNSSVKVLKNNTQTSSSVKKVPVQSKKKSTNTLSKSKLIVGKKVNVKPSRVETCNQQILYICSDNFSSKMLGFSDKEFLSIKEKMGMNHILNCQKISN